MRLNTLWSSVLMLTVLFLPVGAPGQQPAELAEALADLHSGDERLREFSRSRLIRYLGVEFGRFSPVARRATLDALEETASRPRVDADEQSRAEAMEAIFVLTILALDPDMRPPERLGIAARFLRGYREAEQPDIKITLLGRAAEMLHCPTPAPVKTAILDEMEGLALGSDPDLVHPSYAITMLAEAGIPEAEVILQRLWREDSVTDDRAKLNLQIVIESDPETRRLSPGMSIARDACARMR